MNAIDWKSIRTFKGSQNKGYEQLCFQLALRMYGDKGIFTEVDDTGGGDGVEFYQTRAGGKEWGWQAKFYDQSIRLNVSGRKGKIINSLKKSLRVHPNLEKWILCTNSQFTPVEQKWFDTELKKIIPRQRMVKLEHWSEGKIQNLLDKPENNGIKNAFFGKLQLTPDWFLSRFNKKELYNPSFNPRTISSILDHWLNGEKLIPPTIMIFNKEYSNTLGKNFIPSRQLRPIDGKHRINVSYYFGSKSIPILVRTKQLTIIKKVLGILS